MVDYNSVLEATSRIKGFAKNTPIFTSETLNRYLGQQLFFKCECLQQTGSFKIRGATNYILSAIESTPNLKHIVANSSGNHAQAVAYCAKQVGLQASIFAGKNISPVKAAATRSYGANLYTFDTRVQADEAVEEASHKDNTLWVPPFNHPKIIAGQGTASLEAWETLNNDVDAVFAPCGGGGLLSGSLVVARAKSSSTKVIGAEPMNANDASLSLQSGHIVALQNTPDTLADGAATPSVGEHTFPYLQQLDDFIEVSERQIMYWTQWLHHLLKLHIEPTCTMTMEAVRKWAATAPKNSRALIILSGGNISQASMARVWEEDFLTQPPSLTSTI